MTEVGSASVEHDASEKYGGLVPDIESTRRTGSGVGDFNNSETRSENCIRAWRVVLGINIFSLFEASSDEKDLHVH